MIGNKIADRITKVSKNLQQDNSEAVKKEWENIELNRESYLSPEKRQQIINDLKFKK